MGKYIRIIVICCIIIVFLISFVLILFPRKYQDIIFKYSEDYSLPKSMVASIINIESGYDEKAESSAGALGLMQLLPSTAYECADKLDLITSDVDMLDAKTNIMIGCFYLNYLLGVFDNNLVNTLCAYNWGLGNVREWISKGNIDDEGTITNIPVKETRDYIRKYRLNYFVYNDIFGF